MRLLLALAALIAAALVAPRPADACEEGGYGYDTYLDIDPELALVDHTPPSQPAVTDVAVVRAVNPLVGDRVDGCAAGSGRAGSIRLSIRPSTDDSGQIGYAFEFVRGRLPRDFTLPREPLVSFDDVFEFDLSDPDDDDEIDFTLRLVPIDKAGNRGPPSEPFRIRDEGLGCSSAGATPAPLALALVLLLLARRRSPVGVF